MYIQSRRKFPLPEAMGSPYGDAPLMGILPSKAWKDPPKRPLLFVPHFIMFRHSRTIHIPLLGSRFSLPHSPPEQVVKVVKLEPSHFFAQTRWRGRPNKRTKRITWRPMDRTMETAPIAVGIYHPHLGPWTPTVSSSHKCSPGPLDLHP